MGINIFKLQDISKNNSTVNIYLHMESTNREISVAFQQAQLYANLVYFKENTDEAELMKEKLQAAIDTLDEKGNEFETIVQQTEDSDIISLTQEWNSALSDFTAHCSEILLVAESGDYEGAYELINKIQAVKILAQDAQDSCNELLAEKQESVIA